MQSNTARVVVGIVAVAVAIVLFVVLQDDGGDGSSEKVETATTKAQGKGDSPARDKIDATKEDSAAAQVPTIVVEQGEPVGGIAKLSYAAGEPVRFKVESDVSDEIHVHGYDIAKDVTAGSSAAFDFPATIEGVFEVELEQRHVQIIELTVNP